MASAAEMAPAIRQPGWEEGSAILQRWLKVQGLNRPAEVIFPRLTSHEVISGDAERGTRVSFVQASGRGEYRLVVELPNGQRYGEISDSETGGHWHMNEELGIGRLRGTSDLVQSLLRSRQDADFLRRFYQSWRRHPDETRDGILCQVVGLQPLQGGYEFWWFDPESGVLRTIDSLSAERKLIGRVRFSDFRPTDGFIEPYLAVIGEGSQRITVKTLEVQNRALVPPGFFAPTKEERTRWQTSEDVLKKYVRACGGEAALAQIVTRVTKSRGENQTSGVKFAVTVSQKSPKFILSETDVEGLGRSWVGFDGETAWELSELKGFRVVQGAERELYQRNGQLNTEHFPRLFPLRRIAARGELNGRPVVALELASLQARAGTHYFEVESGQLVRIESVLLESGGELPVTIDFSDFRTVDGVSLPFRTVLANPAMRVVTVVDSVQHNLELPEALFRPRKEE